MRAVGAGLVVLGMITSPVVLEALFSGDGRIEEKAIRLILWLIAAGLIGIGLLTVAKPDHLRKNRAGYVLAGITLLLCLGMAECGLRLIKSEGPREYHVKSAEFEYDVALNEHRFRDDPFAEEKNSRRVFMLGDSYIFGSGVRAEDNIDRRMEERLKEKTGQAYEVWNLGLPGMDPPGYLETAQRFRDFDPDLVVVNVYVDNDVLLDGGEQKGGLALLRLLRSAKLGDCSYDWIETYDLEPRIQDMACKGDINPWLLPRAAVGDNQQYYDRIAQQFDRDPRTKESLLAIRALFPGKPFLLVLHPSKYQVGTEHFGELRKLGFTLSSTVVDRKVQDVIMKWAESERVETLDLLPAFIGRTGLFYTYDDHYTPAGCRSAADIIAEHVAP